MAAVNALLASLPASPDSPGRTAFPRFTVDPLRLWQEARIHEHH